MGGGGICEVEGVDSVANHREVPDRSAELRNRKKNPSENEMVVSVPVRSDYEGLLAHREKFTREAERTTDERRLCVFEGA